MVTSVFSTRLSSVRSGTHPSASGISQGGAQDLTQRMNEQRDEHSEKGQVGERERSQRKLQGGGKPCLGSGGQERLPE